MSTTASGERPRGGDKGPKGIDELLIQALLVGGSPEMCAKHAQCSTKTVYRRLRNPEFAARLADERGLLISRTADRLTTFALSAVSKLNDLMGSDDETVALRAANSLLEHATRLREIESFERRLAAMEEAMGEDYERPAAPARRAG
jgi:hypothetical protein